MSITTGNIRAATPMLFMKADRIPVVSMITIRIRTWPVPARARTRCPIMSATPVALRPALRMNMAQTVTTAGLLKPARQSSRSTSPLAPRVPMTSNATTSIRSFSVTKSTSDTARIASTAPISKVMRFRG